MSDPRNYQRRQPPGPGIGWWLWAAFCGLLGLGLLGVIVWAVVRFTLHFTGGSDA